LGEDGVTPPEPVEANREIRVSVHAAGKALEGVDRQMITD